MVHFSLPDPGAVLGAARHRSHSTSWEAIAIGAVVFGGAFGEAKLVPTRIDRNEVRRLLAEERGQLVEVLLPPEFADEHLPAAINVPLKELDELAPRLLERGRAVIAYCYDYQ